VAALLQRSPFPFHRRHSLLLLQIGYQSSLSLTQAASRLLEACTLLLRLLQAQAWLLLAHSRHRLLHHSRIDNRVHYGLLLGDDRLFGSDLSLLNWVDVVLSLLYDRLYVVLLLILHRLVVHMLRLHDRFVGDYGGLLGLLLLS